MIKPSGSLVFDERPARYVNGVRKKDHHLKPLHSVVASDAVAVNERPNRLKASKSGCSLPCKPVISGPRKTRSAGVERKKVSEFVNEKRALSGSSKSRRTSRSKHDKTKNGDGDSTGLSPQVEYDGWVDDTSDVLFINSQSTTTTSNNNSTAIQQGRISPAQLLVKCQESDFERVYDINLHACSLKKIHNLEKFRKLKILDLSCNSLKTIENLSCNTNLKELKLYGNQIMEVKNLEKLTELCSLQLQFNKLTNLGKGLMFAKKLKCLRVDNNDLTQIDAREIAACSQITNLDVSSNKLQNLSVLNCLNSLEELFASSNRLRTLTDLSRCRKLQEVNLSSNSLTDVSGLKGLQLLMTLHLSRNLLTSEAIQNLGKLRSLQELDVSDNKMSKLVSFPNQFPALEVLNLTKNSIEWPEIVHLSGCESLVELFIEDNPFIKSLDSKQSYHQEIHASLPNLELVDGVTVKQTKQKTMPFMRPMSAASGLSARQVQSQLRVAESDLKTFSETLNEKFESLRTTMDTLPAESPRSLSVASDLSITSVSTFAASRPGSSRCNSRSRLQDAKAYATTHFK